MKKRIWGYYNVLYNGQWEVALWSNDFGGGFAFFMAGSDHRYSDEEYDEIGELISDCPIDKFEYWFINSEELEYCDSKIKYDRSSRFEINLRSDYISGWEMELIICKCKDLNLSAFCRIKNEKITLKITEKAK